jgi:hypothetical protein
MTSFYFLLLLGIVIVDDLDLDNGDASCSVVARDGRCASSSIVGFTERGRGTSSGSTGVVFFESSEGAAILDTERTTGFVAFPDVAASVSSITSPAISLSFTTHPSSDGEEDGEREGLFDCSCSSSRDFSMMCLQQVFIVSFTFYRMNVFTSRSFRIFLLKRLSFYYVNDDCFRFTNASLVPNPSLILVLCDLQPSQHEDSRRIDVHTLIHLISPLR